MAITLDTYLSYKLLRIVTTDWKDQKAFALGIIDDAGNVIIPKSKRTSEQSDAFNTFYKLGINIKKIIEKIPGGKSKIASYTAAMWLIREELNNHPEELINMINEMNEEGPVNTAPGSSGSGVAGKDEPLTKPIKKKKMDNEIISTIKELALSQGEKTSLDEYDIVRHVRHGRVVRKKEISKTLVGFKSVDGRAQRMSASERVHRRKSQRVAKIKRRSTEGRALVRRSKSMRKRSSWSTT